MFIAARSISGHISEGERYGPGDCSEVSSAFCSVFSCNSNRIAVHAALATRLLVGIQSNLGRNTVLGQGREPGLSEYSEFDE